jgi:Zn-dependent protease with chaperone function/uncharacterized RDD family membrane protein YckC
MAQTRPADRGVAARGAVPVPPQLFSGPYSIRIKGERAALIWSLLLAPLTIGLIGAIFRSISVSELGLLIVGGMVYVSIARGRLLGSSVRIDSRQFPEVFALVETAAQRLGVPTPQVFVRDDVFVPIAAVGIGAPYSLIISSQYLEHLREGELSFLVARELGHIAAGHTRLTSLLSASGRENPAIALIFGSWLRRTEYTADRVGLACGASLSDAIGAISITTFHAIGRRVDMSRLAEQQRELEAEPTLRMGEWIGGVPYATKRIAELGRYDASESARAWRARLNEFAPLVVAGPDAEQIPERVPRRDCAPVVRRLLAFAIDFIVVGAILKTSEIITVTPSGKNSGLILGGLHVNVGLLHFSAMSVFTILGIMLYSAILVGFTGQTLGMMVMELRVVTTSYRRPGIAQSIWRYTGAAMSLISSLALIGFFMRIHPHDYVSRTRLVRRRAGGDHDGEPLRLRPG